MKENEFRFSPDGNGNPTSLRGTKQSRGLQWTAGTTIEKMPKMVLLKKQNPPI